MTDHRDLETPRRRPSRAWLVAISMVCVVVALALAGTRLEALIEAGPQRIMAMLDATSLPAPFALAGLKLAAVVIGPIPTLPFTVSAGLLFGPMTGRVFTIATAYRHDPDNIGLCGSGGHRHRESCLDHRIVTDRYAPPRVKALIIGPDTDRTRARD